MGIVDLRRFSFWFSEGEAKFMKVNAMDSSLGSAKAGVGSFMAMLILQMAYLGYATRQLFCVFFEPSPHVYRDNVVTS